MKIYHMVGHNGVWSMDSHYINNVGDGFIFSAISYKYGKIGQKLSGYTDYISKSMIDLQFFSNMSDISNKLATYPFHPCHNTSGQTNIGDHIEKAISYQINLGINNIVIPNYYRIYDEKDKIISNAQKINALLKNIKQNGKLYYLTLPLSNKTVKDVNFIEKLAMALTDSSIVFDGYYICIENDLQHLQKINQDMDFFTGKYDLFRKLTKNKFKVAYAYANFDVIPLLSLVNIDIITIGTYENMRNFSIERFTEDKGGGASKGYYFSAKLLNAIKADHVTMLRSKNLLDSIKNDNNIFSDTILRDGYDWNIHKPDVQKNYLLEVSKILKEISSVSLKDRKQYTIDKISNAISLYDNLKNNKMLMPYESSAEHLYFWLNALTK